MARADSTRDLTDFAPDPVHADGQTANSPASRAAAVVRWRRLTWLTIALAAVLFFTRLGARALWASGFRWGEIAREMRLTSNYCSPWFWLCCLSEVA